MQVVSIFSHLSAADDKSHNTFTQKQFDVFKNLSDRICKILDEKPLRHILNTSGIINYPEYQFDMVRLGIGLYGIDPTGKIQDHLEAVHKLTSSISQLREVSKHDFVGYGSETRVMQDTKLATVPIGYADGFNRKLGNGVGKVFVNGHLVPTVGNVCMDMVMIDVTGLDVEEGDNVEIFGPNHSIGQLAEESGTIPYEILTSVGKRVKRV